jgi:DNA-binding response OmpR family regulator
MINAKILLVDDDPAFCRLMEQILTKDGAQVIAVGSCREALRSFDQIQPDLVILDVAINEEDAFDTCRRLRQRSHVPIIMLTAHAQTEYVIRGLTCGADDYVTKPFHLVVLRARIGAVLRRSGFPLASTRPAAAAPDRALLH